MCKRSKRKKKITEKEKQVSEKKWEEMKEEIKKLKEEVKDIKEKLKETSGIELKTYVRRLSEGVGELVRLYHICNTTILLTQVEKL